MTVPIAVLLGFLITAAVTDVARHKIYNWTTYPGIIAGLAINGIVDGWTGLQEALVGFLALGVVMLFCFVLFQLGGGDVKLIAMIGAFLGLRDGLEAMLWTFVLGGIMGAAVLIWQIGVLRIVSKTAGHLWLMIRTRSWVSPTKEEREPLKRTLFLAPAALLSVVILVARRDWW